MVEDGGGGHREPDLRKGPRIGPLWRVGAGDCRGSSGEGGTVTPNSPWLHIVRLKGTTEYWVTLTFVFSRLRPVLQWR